MRTTLRPFLAAIAVALSSCGGGSLPSQQGHLRFVNATSAAGALDLFATGHAVATAVAPLSGSGYADLDHNTYTLDVRDSGNGATLVTTSTTLDKKVHQTLVAATNEGSLVATLLGDDEGDPSKGNAKLRFFNTQTATADAV